MTILFMLNFMEKDAVIFKGLHVDTGSTCKSCVENITPVLDYNNC